MKRAAKIWRAVLSLAVVILIFGIWRLPVGEERYSVIGAWIQVFRAESFMDFWILSPAGPTLALCHITVTLAGVLYLLRLILMVFGKKIHILDLASRAMVFLSLNVCILVANVYESVNNNSPLNEEQKQLVPLLFVSIASLFEYVGFRFLDEWYEQLAAYHEVKRQEREAKLRRKKALYFPGRYPKELTILIWENFRESMSDGILLIVGGALTAIFLIVSFGVFLTAGAIPQIPGIPRWLLRLQGIFQGATVMIIFLCVLLMYNLISNYTKVRNREYRTFLVLGIRTRTIYLLFAVEFGVSMILSAVTGLCSGGLVYTLIRHVLKDRIALPPFFSIEVLGWGGIGFLLILVFATMLNQENILRMGNSTVLYEEKEAETIPNAVWRRIIFGLWVFELGEKCYTMTFMDGRIAGYIFAAIGLFMILTGCMVRSVKKAAGNQDKLLRNILWKEEWRYRFKKNRWSIYVMLVVHICVLSFEGVPLIGAVITPQASDQLPYDIVSMVYDQDMDRVKAVMDTYDVDVQIYPMVRVSSISGNSSLQQDERSVNTEQGAYIGITEDTYRSLKEALGEKSKDLDLKDGEIYTVYQQNVSMPSRSLDYSGSRTGNYLRFGQPLFYYSVDRKHELFQGHKETGRERDLLIGMLGEGEQEHLVVFSDEEFERGYTKIREKNEENLPILREKEELAREQYLMEHEDNLTDGPTNLILWDVPKEQYDDVVLALSFLEEDHPIDRLFDERVGNLYPKDQMITTVREFNVGDMAIQAVAAALLFVFGLFQIYSKTESEAAAIREQDLFLLRLGMKEKERKRLMHRQIHKPFWISAAAGVVVEAVFALLTFENRSYQPDDILRYTIAAVVFTIFYYLLWEIWLTYMERKIWKGMGKQK